MEKVGQADGDEIKDRHRYSHHHLGDDVGRGQHRADNDGDDDEVAAEVPELLVIDDPRQREKTNDNGEFEDQAEGEQKLQGDGDEGIDGRNVCHADALRDGNIPGESRQEPKADGKDESITETRAAEEAPCRSDDEGGCVLLLLWIETRRNEGPDLPEDDPKSQHDPADERQLEADPEGLDWVGIGDRTLLSEPLSLGANLLTAFRCIDGLGCHISGLRREASRFVSPLRCERLLRQSPSFLNQLSCRGGTGFCSPTFTDLVNGLSSHEERVEDEAEELIAKGVRDGYSDEERDHAHEQPPAKLFEVSREGHSELVRFLAHDSVLRDSAGSELPSVGESFSSSSPSAPPIGDDSSAEASEVSGGGASPPMAAAA